jgi:hypothetical protein
LRLDIELLAESAPLLLFLPNRLCGAFRRTTVTGDKPKRDQPLPDIRALQIVSDRAIDRRDGVSRRTRRRA